MLQLRRKKTDAPTAPLVPPWHPNFRNFERLPDTKVVRTAFFVNGGAIVAATIMLMWVASREYELYDLQRQTAALEEQIERDRPGSTQAVAQFKKFQAEAARIKELDDFVAAKPVLSDLLIQLGQSLPSNLAVDGFELRPNGLRLVASVRGAPDQASGHASNYLAHLRENAELGQWFGDIALLNLDRNPQSGRLVVEYFLTFKTPAKK